MHNIFRMGRPVNFKLGTQTEHQAAATQLVLVSLHCARVYHGEYGQQNKPSDLDETWYFGLRG